MTPITHTTPLGELLTSQNKTIARHAMGILKESQRQTKEEYDEEVADQIEKELTEKY